MLPLGQHVRWRESRPVATPPRRVSRLRRFHAEWRGATLRLSRRRLGGGCRFVASPPRAARRHRRQRYCWRALPPAICGGRTTCYACGVIILGIITAVRRRWRRLEQAAAAYTPYWIMFTPPSLRDVWRKLIHTVDHVCGGCL